MYVINAEDLDKSKLYECNRYVRDWLISKHLFVFGMKGDGSRWYFRKTEKLEQALKKMPFRIKVLSAF